MMSTFLSVFLAEDCVKAFNTAKEALEEPAIVIYEQICNIFK